METGRGRANAQASFTARATTRAVAKAEVSDPTVTDLRLDDPSGCRGEYLRHRTAEAHRTKVTPGITG